LYWIPGGAAKEGYVLISVEIVWKAILPAKAGFAIVEAISIAMAYLVGASELPGL